MQTRKTPNSDTCNTVFTADRRIYQRDLPEVNLEPYQTFMMQPFGEIILNVCFSYADRFNAVNICKT